MPIERRKIDPEPGYTSCYYHIELERWTVGEYARAVAIADNDGVPDYAMVAWDSTGLSFSWREE